MVKRIVAGLVLVLSVVLFSSYSYAEEKGLVGCWNFEEGKGDVAKDFSGKGNNGDIYGATSWVKGKYGQALQFDGVEVDDYVDCGNDTSLDIDDEITVEAWVYPTGFAKKGSGGYICSRGYHCPFAIQVAPGGKLNWVYQLFEGNHEYLDSGLSLELNKWQYVAVSHRYSTGEIVFYVNGTKAEKKAKYTGEPKNTGAYLSIGGYDDRKFTGIIDEVRIYNRILTEAEIKNCSVENRRRKHLTSERIIASKIAHKAAIYFPDDIFSFIGRKLPAEVTIPAGEETSGKFSALFRLFDVDNKKEVLKKEEVLVVTAKQSASAKLNISPQHCGAYRLEISLKNEEGKLFKKKQFPFTILPSTFTIKPRLNQDVITRLKKTSPSPVGSKFAFVVIGDSQLDGTSRFERHIRLINTLDADFVIHNGDLISGYHRTGTETDLKKTIKEWQRYMELTAPVKSPLINVVGNHDVWDIQSSKIFRTLFGPTYFSFTYGNSHFIILDTEDFENNQRGLSRGPQLEWLKKDLKKHSDAENIFVFFHRPTSRSYDNRVLKSSVRQIHKLFLQYPVKVVFGSHWHRYCFEKKDNIRYIITGGASSGLHYDRRSAVPVWAENIDTGIFWHHTIVHVSGSDVSIKVKPLNSASLLAEDCVTYQDVRAQDSIPSYYSIPVLPCKDGVMISDQVKITVKNPTDIKATSSLIWNVPSGWKVMPKENKFEIPPNDKVTLSFSVTPPDPKDISPPIRSFRSFYGRRFLSIPTFEARHSYGDGSKFALVLECINIIEQGQCPHTTITPEIDADLFDWQKIIPPFTTLTTSRTLRIAKGKKWNGPSDLSGQIFLSWDEKNLYLAAEVTDDIFVQDQKGKDLWRADSITLGFDILNNISRRFCNWRYDSDDREIILALTQDGPQAWCTDGRRKGLMPDTLRLAIVRKDSRILYEAAIPWKFLKFKPEIGKVIGFDIAINDSDGKGRKASQVWALGLMSRDCPSPRWFGDLKFVK